MRRSASRNALACLLWLSAAPAIAQPSHVMIDFADRAYTVFVGIPKELPKEKFRLIEATAKKEGTAEVVAWQAFAGDLGKYVGARIVKNEYPEIKIAEDISALLAKYPMTPFGVTWNGGIAFTRNDYTYARNAHQRHLVNPGATVREADARADPVHPRNHTAPLLGR